MQRRVVALLIGAAAVLILVVVLFVRVRAVATPPVVSPAEVIAASRAASPGPAATRPSPLAPPRARGGVGDPPDQGARADQIPVEVGARAVAGARARARLTGDEDPEGERGNLPRDLAADTPPEMVEKRRAVSDAYDTGDYETAFRSAQDFLRFQADNEYVQRVAAVSACALGDESSARMHYEQMDQSNRRIVQVRCRRYGINL